MTALDGRPLRVVALGGGHGLSAILAALRTVTSDLVAIVTVADDGGSSGRLRAGMPGLLPPGDLRMALCALAADTAEAQAWAAVLQHRFDRGELKGHPVGNLVLAGLFEASETPAAALGRLAALMGAVGTVLPLADEPVEIAGDVLGAEAPTAISVVRGQVALASTSGRVQRAWLEPADPAVSAEVVAALERADIITLGPGSLFTSQLPHLLTPAVIDAMASTAASFVYVLNLEPQPGESDGLDPAGHLETLRAHLPTFRPDVVIADSGVTPSGSPDHRRLIKLAARWGSVVVHRQVALAGRPGEHDPALLADALRAACEVVQDGAPTGQDPAGGRPGGRPGRERGDEGPEMVGRQRGPSSLGDQQSGQQRTTVGAGGDAQTRAAQTRAAQTAPTQTSAADQDGGRTWRP